MTIGIVLVAFASALAAACDEPTSTFMFRRTRSSASSAKRSTLPSAQRYSRTTSFPSTWPSSLNACAKAVTMWAAAVGVVDISSPTWRVFGGACAWVDRGRKIAAIAMPEMT
jgi:hypothetical protein